jgi:hypothetical protein
MKRSFGTFVDGDSCPYYTQAVCNFGGMVQPDFPALEIGVKCEFPMPETMDVGGFVHQSKTCSSRDLMASVIREKYLEDQLLNLSEGFNGKSARISDRVDLFADARQLWDDVVVRDSETDQRFASCCASLCSTIASAASTVASATLSPQLHQSAPAAFGKVSGFALTGNIDHFFAPQRHKEHSPMYSTNFNSLINVPPASVGSSPPDSLEAAAAAAASAAATWMILKALESRAAAAAASPPGFAAAAAPPPADLEEYCLGSGWPGARAP